MVHSGIKALVDAGVMNQIPDAYVKPVDKRPTADEVLPGDCIPVIDLEGLISGSDRAGVVKSITEASKTWGLFQVINHGIHASVIEGMVSGVREFFDLPVEEKMKHYSEEVFTPVRYCTSMTPSKETHMEWHDHLQHYVASEQDEHPWSELNLPNYEQAAQSYLKKTAMLGKRLKSALSEGLGLKPNRIERAFGQQEVIMRSNYYPPCPNPDLALGMNGHSDSGGITILLQVDNVGGLQAFKDGKWYEVQPVTGALTINIADQIEILSNGAYKSVEHRVVVNSSISRLSIAVFCNPSRDAVIGPMQEVLDENNPPLYKSTLYGEHITNVYTTYLDGKHSKMLEN